MSKDIRSFFTILSKKSATTDSKGQTPRKTIQVLDSDDEDVISDTPKKSKNKVQSKRRAQVISSDSEDESQSSKKKPSSRSPAKKSKTSGSESHKQKKKDKNSLENPTKKPFNLDSLNKPIQQSEVKYVETPVEDSKDKAVVKKDKSKRKKKKEKDSESGVHHDKDFAKTLEDLDDDSDDTILLENLDILNKTIEEATLGLHNGNNIEKAPSIPKHEEIIDRSLTKESVDTKKTPNKTSNTDGQKKEHHQSDTSTPRKSEKRPRKLSESTPTSSKKPKLEQTDSGIDNDFEKLQRKRNSAGLYVAYLHRPGPKHHGEKEYPKGNPNCLKGLTFLRTGVLDSLEGEEFGNLVGDHGGRVVHAVSKKVNYLVVGDEPGPAKLEKARKYNIPEISEDEFLDMILIKSGMKPKYAVPNSESEDWGLGSSEEGISTLVEVTTPNEEKAVEVTSDEANKFENIKKASSEKLERKLDCEKREKVVAEKDTIKEVAKISKKDIISPPKKTLQDVKKEQSDKVRSVAIEEEKGLKEKANVSKVSGENLSWTDKYKPTNIKGIIGQQDANSNMNKLKKWLENWFKNADPERRKKLPRPTPYNQYDGAYFKAALLSGPPGVGKTTTATLVCKELGFDIVEFNASDTRNKKLLHEEISHMMSSKTVAGFASGHGNINQKRVLLMDEVDGMAGNEDRGGIAELINFIKTASFPIICMCNNRDLPKMRSLVNHCYALKFGKPNVMQVRGAMMSICFKEGLTIKPEALAQLITGTGCDIRQTLNHLSMWSAAEKNLSSDTIHKESKNSQKDVVFGAWDVIRKVFNKSENKDMSLVEKARLFFYDYSFGPMFVQENYLTVTPECTGPKQTQRLETLIRRHLAADCLSQSDLIERRIRSSNNWSLLDTQAYFSTVMPSHYLSGTIGQVRFPGWFGKNSQRTKSLRITAELYTHARTVITGDKLSMRLDYAQPLMKRMLKPLIEKQAAGIDDTLEVMKTYSLLREDLTNLCDLMSSFSHKHQNPFDKVSSNVKAALTRKYNKVMVLSFAPPTASKKKKTAKLEQDDLFDEDEEPSEGEENDDNIDDDGLVKQVKAKKATQAGSSKPSGSQKDSTKANKGKGGKTSGKKSDKSK